MNAASRHAPRVILDTPVLLACLMADAGAPAQLRQAWQQGRLLPLVDRALADELLRALAWPALSLSPSDQQELLADFLPYAEVVTETPDGATPAPAAAAAGQKAASTRRQAAVPACLALARRTRARWLVSPQPHRLPARRRCECLPPQALLAALGTAA